MTGPADQRSLLARLRERKIAQWGVAYLAGGWVALQLVDLLGETFSFSPLVQRAVMFLALAQWELGQEEEAVGLLEDAYEEGSLWPEVNVDPLFASLRTQPRFQALVRKLGLL